MHRTVRIAAALVLATGALAGCGSQGGQTHAVPHRTASGTHAPNVGDRTLAVGQPIVVEGLKTTLDQVENPYPPGRYRKPPQGQQWVGLHIVECEKSAGPAGQTTGAGQWYVATPTGDEYTAGEAWIDWPSPRFPEYVSTVPGGCVRGWMALPVPTGTKLASVIYRAGGQTVADWKLRGLDGPSPTLSTKATTVAPTTLASACQQIQSALAPMKGEMVTKAREWLPLDAKLIDWKRQKDAVAHVVTPLERAVEKRLKTKDRDKYGLRVDAARADDAIWIKVNALSRKCEATGAKALG